MLDKQTEKFIDFHSEYFAYLVNDKIDDLPSKIVDLLDNFDASKRNWFLWQIGEYFACVALGHNGYAEAKRKMPPLMRQVWNDFVDGVLYAQVGQYILDIWPSDRTPSLTGN